MAELTSMTWIRRRFRWAKTNRLSRDDVVAAYRWLLGREPEDEQAIAKHKEAGSAAQLIHTFVTSQEFHQRWKTSPYYHYHATLDVEGIIRAHEDKRRIAKPGHLVNFIGVAMNIAFMPFLSDHSGTVEALPIPANWHAEMGEFAAALRAVDLAQKRFTMIELGCGWGCWMNNTGLAARRRGLKVRLIGVEGDHGHIGFAREALETNGVDPKDYKLWHGIAGAQAGTALFPRQRQSGEDWGLEPKFGLSPDERAKLLADGPYDELPVLALDDIVGDERRIDLLHMDIQGGEADFVRDCMPILVEKVAYIVIGTHSRAIEGRLMTDLTSAGWILEIERPSDFVISESGPVTVTDGIQGWRNPRLAPV
jgi:FkbM family methyltransferase